MNDKRELYAKTMIYFTLSLWYSTEVLFHSMLTKFLLWDVEDLNDIISYVVLSCLVIVIVFFQKYSKREIVLIGSISVVVLIATIQSNQKVMMSTWLFVLAFKYCDFEKTIRILYYSQLIPTLTILYLFFSGTIGEKILYRDGIIRHSYGFMHPNQLGIRIFSIAICRCYIRRNKRNIIDYIFVLLVALFTNIVTNSRTSSYALVLLFLLMLMTDFFSIFKFNTAFFSKVLIVISVVIVVMSVVLSMRDTEMYHITRLLDKYTGYRFSTCHQTLMIYGIKPLGQDVKLLVSRPDIGGLYKLYLDNSYLAILIRYGAIMFLIFMWLYFSTMKFYCNKNDFFLVAIFLLYIVFGINENNLYLLSQNAFLLLLSVPIYHREEYKSVVMHRKIKFVLGKA